MTGIHIVNSCGNVTLTPLRERFVMTDSQSFREIQFHHRDRMFQVVVVTAFTSATHAGSRHG